MGNAPVDAQSALIGRCEELEGALREIEALCIDPKNASRMITRRELLRITHSVRLDEPDDAA